MSFLLAVLVKMAVMQHLTGMLAWGQYVCHLASNVLGSHIIHSQQGIAVRSDASHRRLSLPTQANYITKQHDVGANTQSAVTPAAHTSEAEPTSHPVQHCTCASPCHVENRAPAVPLPLRLNNTSDSS